MTLLALRPLEEDEAAVAGAQQDPHPIALAAEPERGRATVGAGELALPGEPVVVGIREFLRSVTLSAEQVAQGAAGEQPAASAGVTDGAVIRVPTNTAALAGEPDEGVAQGEP